MTDHPITPPPELKEQWRELALRDCQDEAVCDHWLMNRAAQWGANTELEACIAWLVLNGYGDAASRVRAARRPKPLSLKEQAWKLLETYGTSGVKLTADQCDTIRLALEALPDE